MDKTPLILAIDQGTTSSRIFLFDLQGKVIDKQQRSHQFFTPEKKFVEHDANEIWQNVSDMYAQCLVQYGRDRIQAIGITNQRETIVFWDRDTGEVLRPAIVWQDNRTEAECEALKSQGLEASVREKTGLTINPYFSATKIAWALKHDDAVKQALKADRLCVGTIDCFLMYRLSGGQIFKTDVTNASRTMLYNIQRFEWDSELLEALSIPESILPEVVASDADFGESTDGIPITGVAGDQQSALIGQTCFDAGQAKMTFGTGGFYLLNIGEQFHPAPEGLLTTVAYEIGGARRYAIEGSIFHAASIINWLQRLGLIDSPAECDRYYQEADPNSETILIPAFTGLGAPHWRADLTGSWHGLTLSTGRAELVQSALASIALQSVDLFSALADHEMKTLRVDGGVSQSDCLCQLIADLTGLSVQRPQQLETTVLGAMVVAGLGRGLFKSFDELSGLWQLGQSFEPRSGTQAKALLARWQDAIEHSLKHD